MTTVAAVQGDGWAVIGHDSRVTTISEGGRYYSLPKKNGKVIKNGEFLIGVAGDLRVINVISYVFRPPAIPKTTNLDKYIIGTFLPALRTCLDDQGVQTKEGSGADLIILVRGKVYEIGEHFEWSPDTNNIYSIGSGAGYALGCLWTILDKDTTVEDARSAIKTSLEVAAALDPYTGSPFSIYTQKA